MAAPAKIIQLIDRFKEHRESYVAGHYNETQLRREFIDPFFKALGWDIDNEKGKSEAYKDVIHEDAIQIGGVHKAPDYCMRVGGIRKYFVEAKKPSVDIKDDVGPAYQIRRYGWSAKLSLSILTDFEEFAVYDCRIKPGKSDGPAVARIAYYTIDQLVEKWDEIASIFSPEAIESGSFDKFAEASKLKRGTEEVDDAFLEEIEEWRELLAKNIAVNNKKLSQRELNFAVQATLDRIIFLRICEDRGVEPDLRLQSETNGPGIYGRLKKLFRDADDRYNSGLFHFKDEDGEGEAADTLSLGLSIDDDVLKKIISHLYYPESPYAFSVFSADILGQVYERFLGKVIRLTDGHHAKVEEKPEVRKAGGVYYTPTYIVEYIVKHTVGKLLEGKTPKEVVDLKIVDPACGSGSFLLGAYQFLLNWHLEQYSEDPKKWKKQLIQTPSGELRLCTAERKRILLANIFGVDIDSQAVEVTKLSLLLKVLEGESQVSIQDQFAGMRERVLPDLGKNIQCGNSLIGPDFYAGQQQGMFEMDEEEKYRINVFDWESSFTQVFKRKNAGFDAVIGNPPYVRQEMISDQKPYYRQHYEVFHSAADLYVYFFERGLNVLRQGGSFGIIVANKWMRANYGRPLRDWLKARRVELVVDFGDLQVFKGATTYPCIIFVQKDKPNRTLNAVRMESLEFRDLGAYVEGHKHAVSQEALNDGGWSLGSELEQKLLEKLMHTGVPLEKCVGGKIFRGVLTGLNEAFVIDEETKKRLIKEDKKSSELIKPFVVGRDVKRYVPLPSGKYIILMPRGWTREQSGNAKNAWGWLKQNYPAITQHIGPFEESAEKRYDKGEYWWELRACGYYGEFERPKLVFPDIATRLSFTFDEAKFYSANTTYFTPTDDKYLMGILNSSLMNFVYRNISSSFRGGYLRAFTQYLETLPIHSLDLAKVSEKKKYDQMVALVEKMISLNKLHPKTPHEQESLKRQIEATDRQIDQLVYELYGLNEKETIIIEESSV